jgi:hypothetical protein
LPTKAKMASAAATTNSTATMMKANSGTDGPRFLAGALGGAPGAAGGGPDGGPGGGPGAPSAALAALVS